MGHCQTNTCLSLPYRTMIWKAERAGDEIEVNNARNAE